MFFVMGLSLCFISCGDDEDDGDGYEVKTTWKWEESEGGQVYSLTIVLNGNGQGNWSSIEDSGKKSGTLTYKSEGAGRMYIKLIYTTSEGTGSDEFYAVIKGNKMYLYEDRYDGDDLEFILIKI